MELLALGKALHFLPVQLSLQKSDIVDLFAGKNNKTVAETLVCSKYRSLSGIIHQRYPYGLDQFLGAFLLRLKQSGDMFYKRFLNAHGDQTYCQFSISKYLQAKGVYCFSLDGNPEYLGRSRDPFRTRINCGYGRLSPKNCYRDGQVTNCHLNSLLAKHWSRVELFVCPLENDDEISDSERDLIARYRPAWNIAMNSKQ
jgi:hypothetical protein